MSEANITRPRASSSPKNRTASPCRRRITTSIILPIFGTLVVLTIVTVAVAFMDFKNEAIRVAVALLIAATKAMCVALFFMHLKFEGKLIYAIFIVPLCLCVLLTVALIPDILMTQPGSHSSSLHLFNSLNHLFQAAVGAE